ncbi:Superoxide-generating NADPH oxidase heavy chain subunit A [Mycena chlorophos]|uniref:Superoxide-generating NADPH oxidase heavy chain subunit A n=1 Tax=Mycena chlorophos TaxID=658473 RepID=A0A8H6WCS3_MYCCL|nr:Superoxide-generating NADPH oxidase heavy chain subunit A [Mycena chlorophos]
MAPPSRSPARRKRTTSRSTSVSRVTSPPRSRRRSAATGKGSKDEKGAAGGKVIGTNTNPPLNRTPAACLLLVGAGIGVTPFASILKNIWYRMNNSNTSKPTRLSKVYFTWVIRDFGTAEWFHSLLHAIEEQDTQKRIEINIYLTAKIKEDDMNNIIVQDAITSLRAPTHFGRPHWDLLVDR